MSRILIKSKTSLTQTGYIGAALFVFAPIASAFFYVRAITSVTPQDAEILMAVSIACGVGALIGIVLMVIGKETMSEALSGEEVEKYDAEQSKKTAT